MIPNARKPIIDGEIYHLITRGNNRKKVFWDEDDYQVYLDLIKEYKERYPLELFHYCLMPNHIHLLVRVIQGEQLSRFMQSISQRYSHHYKRNHGHVGHLWQGRYKSLHITDDAYLMECGRYIERNPVRAAMVTYPKDWAWSSYRYYAQGEENALLTEDMCYLDLGLSPQERQKRYERYVLAERPYEQLVDQQLQIH